MDREDIIRMAREVGLDPDLWNYTDAFERFAALVAAAERRACADECVKLAVGGGFAADCAAAIRERDEQ